MTLWIATMITVGAFSHVSLCQEKLAPTYRLHFRLQETGAATKTTTTNRFALIVQSKSRGKINASRRIPFYTSSKGEGKELHTAALGSIIECTPEQTDNGVRLQCAFESSFVEPGQAGKSIPIGFLPVVNSRQLSTTATVALGKEIQIATMDDPASRSSLEVYVTAERIGPVIGGQ